MLNQLLPLLFGPVMVMGSVLPLLGVTGLDVAGAEAGRSRCRRRRCPPCLKRIRARGSVEHLACRERGTPPWRRDDCRRHESARRTRDGIDEDEAADVVWLLNDPVHFHILVLTRGWSEQKFQDWLSRALSAELLGR